MNAQPMFLIPNVTSARNTGDAAMLFVLVTLIKTHYPNAEIVVHSTEPDTHERGVITTLRSTLYHWAVFENPSLLIRLYRMMVVSLYYLAVRFSLNLLRSLFVSRSAYLAGIDQDYRRASVIIFVGGGYLHAKRGITQSLNLIMQALPFALASCFRVKKITAPIGIGPFAYKWQEQFAYRVLNSVDYIAVREHVTYQKAKQYFSHRVVQSSDHALLLPKQKNVQPKSKTIAIGFTIREWLKGERQQQLETAYVEALSRLAKKQSLRVYPIVQVHAPKFGEGDGEVTERVATRLQRAGVAVEELVYIHSVAHAVSTYKKLDLLVGMRMHSNIIAATQGVPILPISYEYKTEGIAKDLGVESYCLPCDSVTGHDLYHLLTRMIQNRQSISQQLIQRLREIRSIEEKRWQEVLSV